MKVLHITNWYPNEINSKDALWIKNHISSLSPYVSEQLVIHLEIKPFKKLKLISKKKKDIEQFMIYVPFRKWIVIEWLSLFFLVFFLIKHRVNKRFDIINFHIAYPLLAYWHLIKKYIKIPIVITEHWSAYHYNFGVEKELLRARRIFQQDIPLITISKALKNDIEIFSKARFPTFIIPNVVVDDLFCFDPGINRRPFFFMVSQWKWPKRPLIVFQSFKEFATTFKDFKLKVGGYGEDYYLMEDWIRDNGMENSILLMGKLDAKDIAYELKHCTAFIHCSEYETFSVVCAEAVNCHTPVVASRVGGITEVVAKDEGILVESMEINHWLEAMTEVTNRQFQFRGNRFAKPVIGKQYYEALQKIKHGVSQ